MSPLMQRTLENKNERRKRLMALPYPEKVRIVEQMRAAAREIQSAQGSLGPYPDVMPTKNATDPTDHR